MTFYNYFEINSANADKYPELYELNINLFIPQIFDLINLNDNIDSNILDISTIEFYNKQYNIDSNIIKSLFDYYKSDKGNTYASIYAYFLNKYVNKKCRLLEIGLGTNNPNLISTMGNDGIYRCGGSLRSFRDYLSDSSIYGADVDSQSLFNENRILTYYVDQLEKNTFTNLYDNCGNEKFDIIIDDGLHCIGANLNTLIFALENINNNGLIIIEDIISSKMKAYQIIDHILKSKNKNKYKTTFVNYNDKKGFVYIIEVL